MDSLEMSLPQLKSIREYDLCYGCGVCAAVCPKDCIEMQTLPPGIFRRVVDESRCEECKLCVKVCPAIELNRGLSKVIRSCFLGHATDTYIRHQSSSGGVATSLLLYLLEAELVEHVIVAGELQVTKFGMLGRSILTNSKEKVISSKGSKYAPVAIDRALKQVKNTSGNVAVVGLPCHLRGVLKASSLDPSIGRKILITIGLACNHISTGDGIQQVSKLVGLRESLERVFFRGEGWPGQSLFYGRTSSKTVPFQKWANAYFTNFLFAAEPCLLCADAGNEVADLSLADPWPLRLRRPGSGNTVVAVRSSAGLKYLELAEKNGFIKLEKVDTGAMTDIVKHNEIFKKIYMPYRWRLLNLKKISRPLYYPLNTLGRIAALVNSCITYACLKASTNRAGLLLIYCLPRRFFAFVDKVADYLKSIPLRTNNRVSELIQ